MSADVARGRYDPAAHFAFSSSNPMSMPYLTQQYALPLHQAGYQKGNAGSGYGDGAYSSRAENTLRRKTPNGTLNAGYDGSFETPHPQKHQLLPVTEGTQSRLAPSANVKRTFLQHQQRQSNGMGRWSGMGAQGWDGSQAIPPQSSIPVMDSMLNQMPIHPYHAQQFFEQQTVPSVLQPPFQHLGPTASGMQGSGPYGPYWHDGTFVPYRPAAVRDPRFYHHHVAHWPSSLSAPHLAQHGTGWQQHALHQAQWGHMPAVQPFPNATPNYSFPHDNSVQAQNFGSYGHLTPTPGQHHQAFNQWGAHPQYSDQSMGYGLADTFSQQTDVTHDYGPESPNGKQRDRTFAWALQQYRELLFFIHHTRRHHEQTRHLHGQQLPQRPSFYPKPPKPSRSGSTLKVNKSNTGGDSKQGTDSFIAADGPSLTDSTLLTSNMYVDDSDLATPKASSPAGWMQNGLPQNPDEFLRRSSYEPYMYSRAQWPNSMQNPADQFKTVRRSSASAVASALPSLPPDAPPPARANVALTYMMRLCQETDWQWTDGMHLAGCLAYGLGSYQKALRWYTKVLDTDPKHLEATSNLAATLLALGRREEAEQHWMRVVKAAPNHFEAVEHLIGMLCNAQRSRDAIRVIEYVERSLRQPKKDDLLKVDGRQSECSSSASRSPCISDLSDNIAYDFDADGEEFNADCRETPGANEPGFGSSGFAISGCDNGRILALIHAKGNMLYGSGDNAGAARAFEDAVLIAAGRTFDGIQRLVKHILTVVSSTLNPGALHPNGQTPLPADPILLTPEQALATSKLCFPHFGELPGLQYVAGGPQSLARNAVVSTTSNSLLSLAKIFQDGMSTTHRAPGLAPLAASVRDILALYYLSLSLQPSPSTANNVGILLAGVQQATPPAQTHAKQEIPGVVPGSGIALALQYYNYGLQLDAQHAHLYTNLGSLLKDIGQLDAAIGTYERAVKCDGRFDIALANLANAVKDKGRINDAIVYYKRAVEVSPDFAEAVCGLANALNSVCGWNARGGIADEGGKRDPWHVDAAGVLVDARMPGVRSSGWIKRVVDIVEKQLKEGEGWGVGTLTPTSLEELVHRLMVLEGSADGAKGRETRLRSALTKWSGQKREGARVTRLIERTSRRIGWHWYRDAFINKTQRPPSHYDRLALPSTLTVPAAPTVLPFHTFTCPMSATQIRQISQRNALRISASTLRAPWLPPQVYPPPPPPAPALRVGYVSSDFNNHPLAHLMQSVFGLHDPSRVTAHCYATTASDRSAHRAQIETEAPVFVDASAWSPEQLVRRIVADGIHILVNLNGYTRGARNDVFAARPAPVQMSFMGFAGTLGAEWCDYLLADATAVPPSTLRPGRGNVDVDHLIDAEARDSDVGADGEGWVYGENVIFCRETFFCCDHKQSAPDAVAPGGRLSWDSEQRERRRMRRELFPDLDQGTVIFANFNQLYKIDPTTLRTWLRILTAVPNSILWLLRFPDPGEPHLLTIARLWAGPTVAARIRFTDVAPKHLHIARARVPDLVLDTPECNAHTTAADVLWAGSPLLTRPRWAYKMCSRMAASIVRGALPRGRVGEEAWAALVAKDEGEYVDKAVALAGSLARGGGGGGAGGSGGGGVQSLLKLRRLLFDARYTCALFDTRRWVRDLEVAYREVWARWERGVGGDVWLRDILPSVEEEERG